MNYKKIGTWWNDKNIQLIKIEAEIYALHGWNGEQYIKCWKVSENLLDIVDNKEYTITPIYKCIDNEEENYELIGYEVQ